MNVLVLHPNSDSLEMLRFCLESQVNLVVRTASTFQVALDDLLADDPVDLIVCSSEAETEKLFKYLLSAGAGIPLILIGDLSSAKMQAYPDLLIMARLPMSEVPKKLIKIVEENFQNLLKERQQNEYCRIHPQLLLMTTPLKSDVYIRLSSVKYIKLFRSGAEFTQHDLERYLVKRKVDYLYVKTQETKEFVEKFRLSLAQMVETAKPGDGSLLETASEVHSLIRELSQQLGFDSTVQELARHHIQLTIKAIGRDPELMTALSKSQMRGRNYLSSHSVLLANVACSLASLVKLPSDTTFHKLILASLFHDFVFQDPIHAKISTKKELEDSRSLLGEEAYQTILNHTRQSAEMVKNLKEVPGEVDFLILEHHERPDGSGFPQGLTSLQITPLSAIFIVAHEIMDQMIAEGQAFSMKIFLGKVQDSYQSGTFKKVWKALQEQESGRRAA